MTHSARGSFTIDHQESTPAPWDGGAMSRTRFTKTFSGELVGSSVVETIMLKGDGDGPMAYVGLERIACAVGERTGTFLLLHSATANGAEHTTLWTIVPGSGTDDLRGIRGTFQILDQHAFVLEYDLGG